MNRARTALGCLPLFLLLVACGQAGAPGSGTSGPVSPRPTRTPAAPSPDREALLLSCPAQAPSWDQGPVTVGGLAGEAQQRERLGLRHDLGYLRWLHAQHDAGKGTWSTSWGFLMTAAEEAQLWRLQARLDVAARTARGYLDRLPAEQVGGPVAIDIASGSVTVQVTRDAAQVRSALQQRIGSRARVRVETVRYSYPELTRIAARIMSVRGLKWSAVSTGGGNDRVDVMVPGALPAARRLILTVADPCSFTLTQGSAAAAAIS